MARWWRTAPRPSSKNAAILIGLTTLFFFGPAAIAPLCIAAGTTTCVLIATGCFVAAAVMK